MIKLRLSCLLLCVSVDIVRGCVSLVLACYLLITIISRCVKLHWLKIDESEQLEEKNCYIQCLLCGGFIDYGVLIADRAV